jgi:hypothetical protein
MVRLQHHTALTGSARGEGAGCADSGTTRLGLGIGTSGGSSWETSYHDSGLAAGVWYHVGVTYDDSTRAYRIRIWNNSTQSILGTDKTGQFNSNINVSDAYCIVAYDDGLMDELAVFNDCLTTTEIDAIRQGTYLSSGGSGSTDWTDVEYIYDPSGRRGAITYVGAVL